MMAEVQVVPVAVRSAGAARELLKERLFGSLSAISAGQRQGGNLESRRIAFSTLHGLLERTIVNGEGNSVLVVGPRGSGKTWLVEQVLLSLGGVAKTCKQNFIKVYLNGLVHTDDRLALRDIARQLHISHDVDRELSVVSNPPPLPFPSSSLPLSLSSPSPFLPSPSSRSCLPPAPYNPLLSCPPLQLSFASALSFLLDALSSGSHANQSLVFILDEFDQFAHHKSQSLLYNLFDASQSASNPVAVLGLTVRLDIVELLEKRVKSRFSHRQINLHLDYSFDEYVTLFCDMLTLPLQFPDKEYLQQWQKHVQDFTTNISVRRALRQVYSLSPDPHTLTTFLTLPVCKLGLPQSLLSSAELVRSASLMCGDEAARQEGLEGLTILELCLLVAMSHVSDTSQGDPVNFEMVYCEYKRFCQRSQAVKLFSRTVAMKAFEHLLSMGLVHPVDAATSNTLKEYQLVQLQFGEEAVRLAVQHCPGCPTDLSRWAGGRGVAAGGVA